MNNETHFNWLSHNGEVAQLIRNIDWESTSLGSPQKWPHTLKLSINLILNSGIPMGIAWGPDLIHIYNDSFIPILGSQKHPYSLGKKRELTWPEAWSTLGPLMYQVYETGKQIGSKNLELVLERNGHKERAFFNYSYSPIYNENQKVEGVLVTGVEITSAKLFQNELESSRQDLHDFFMQISTPMCILVGDDYKFALANEPYNKLVQRDILGKTLKEAFEGEDVAFYLNAVDKVYKTGLPLTLTESPLNIVQESGELSDIYINTNFTPIRGENGRSKGVIVHVQEVTDLVLSRKMSEKLTDDLKSERENFRNLFRQTPEMVCILSGSEHTFEFVNEAHIKALGFDATGMTVRKAQPESVEVHGILDEVYQTGVTAHLNEIPVTVGTKLRYFNLTYAARKDQNGRPNGMMILGTEITDQVEARLGIIKAKLEAQINLNKLDTIVTNLNEGLVFVDLDGDVIYMNPEALRIHGYKNVAEVKSKNKEYENFFELFDLNGNSLESKMWPVIRLKNGEVFTDYEVKISQKDTKHTWIGSFSGIRVSDHEGIPFMSVLSVKDITSKMKIEMELKEALRARDEFLSIASHELRTPLTSLKIQLQMASRGYKKSNTTSVSNERMERVFNVSLKQVERLSSLIDDLLDVSRIQSGKLTNRFEPTQIRHLITELLERFSEQSHLANAPLEFFSDDNPTVNCDPFRIDQVLSNLISNAIKYAPENPIKVYLTQDARGVTVKVQDFGMGIALDKIDLIFNRFERVSEESNISGLGLGLYITKSIVESHGGNIVVESELNKGSTFSVFLPYKN